MYVLLKIFSLRFCKMSMRGDNNTANCIPDILHVFSGGIIKSSVSWVSTIIKSFSLSSDRRFVNNVKTLDNRIINFPSIPILPRINWTRLTESLVFLAEEESEEEKEKCYWCRMRIKVAAFRSSIIPAVLRYWV